MVAKSPVDPSSPRATQLTQKQGVPDGKGKGILSRAAMSGKHGGLIDAHVHDPGLPGCDPPVKSSPLRRALTLYFVFFSTSAS